MGDSWVTASYVWYARSRLRDTFHYEQNEEGEMVPIFSGPSGDTKKGRANAERRQDTFDEAAYRLDQAAERLRRVSA